MVELKQRQSPKYVALFMLTSSPMAGRIQTAMAAKKTVVLTICPMPMITAAFQFFRKAPRSTSSPAMNSSTMMPTSDTWPSVVASASPPASVTMTPVRMKATMLDWPM